MIVGLINLINSTIIFLNRMYLDIDIPQPVLIPISVQSKPVPARITYQEYLDYPF